MEPFPGAEDADPDDDLIDQLLLVARSVREQTDNFPPIITWQPAHGGPAISTGIEPTETLTGNFQNTFNRLRKLTGEPDWFAVTLDAYTREQPAGGPAPEPDALHQAFLNGDPHVVEQLVVIYKDPAEDDLLMYRQIYRYTPVDGWEWDPPQYVESPNDAVCSAVRMFH